MHLWEKAYRRVRVRSLKHGLTNPQFPKLFVINNRKMGIDAKRGNIDFIHDFLPKSKLQALQNQCGFHICPSETEGFGHYIMEALSCSAVVVTTNAPPMNEFILTVGAWLDIKAPGHNTLPPITTWTNHN